MLSGIRGHPLNLPAFLQHVMLRTHARQCFENALNIILADARRIDRRAKGVRNAAFDDEACALARAVCHCDSASHCAY